MLLREVLGLPFPLFFKSADSGVCLWVDKRYIRREGGNSLAGQWLGLCASTAASCIAQPPPPPPKKGKKSLVIRTRVGVGVKMRGRYMIE